MHCNNQLMLGLILIIIFITIITYPESALIFASLVSLYAFIQCSEKQQQTQCCTETYVSEPSEHPVAPPTIETCKDTEANAGDMDGDEGIVYNSTHRNDETRALEGISNRRRDMDKYLREEVEEAEDREWWGRSET